MVDDVMFVVAFSSANILDFKTYNLYFYKTLWLFLYQTPFLYKELQFYVFYLGVGGEEFYYVNCHSTPSMQVKDWIMMIIETNKKN